MLSISPTSCLDEIADRAQWLLWEYEDDGRLLNERRDKGDDVWMTTEAKAVDFKLKELWAWILKAIIIVGDLYIPR